MFALAEFVDGLDVIEGVGGARPPTDPANGASTGHAGPFAASECMTACQPTCRPQGLVVGQRPGGTPNVLR